MYKDYSIELLNLMSDPSTNTTKTFPTLLTVAKLIHHIEKTGETVIILTPSSGNKATAFRAAVEKAIEKKLVAAEKLRTITLIPRESVSKFRASKLYNDKKLNKLNPVFIYSGDESDDVKKIAFSLYNPLIERSYISNAHEIKKDKDKQSKEWDKINIGNTATTIGITGSTFNVNAPIIGITGGTGNIYFNNYVFNIIRKIKQEDVVIENFPLIQKYEIFEDLLQEIYNE